MTISTVHLDVFDAKIGIDLPPPSSTTASVVKLGQQTEGIRSQTPLFDLLEYKRISS